MKKLLLLLLFAPCALAQVNNPSVRYVTTAPSGTCAASPPIQVVVASGAIFTCDNGTWAAATSGGAGGFPITIGTTAIGSGGTATTIAGLTLTTSSINGVSPTTGGSSTQFLNGAGSYSTPAGGTTTNALTLNNSGTGAASGSTFNGSGAVTLSYNTIGAAAPGAANTWTALQTFGTNISIGGVTVTGATGTGNNVFATNPTITGATLTTTSVNGITLTTGGSSSQFLNGAGAYSTPSGSGTVTASPQYDIAYYPTTGTVSTVQGAAIAGFVYGSASGAPAAATAAQAATLIQGLTGCNTASYVFTPQASDCVAQSGGSGISGLTANYIPLAGSATTITANSHLDDGVTTASTVTSSEALAAPSVTTTGTASGSVGLTAGASVASAPTSTVLLTVPTSVTAYAMEFPAAQPTSGNTFLSCTPANPSVCTFTAGGGSLAFPETVSGTTTSGGIPYFSTTTTLTSSGILNSNILVKGGGAGGAPTNSSITDNSTTVTTTDTGGYVGPVFTANGTTAGFIDFPQGSTSSAVAPCNTATSICLQAPTAVTSQLRTFAGTPATGFSLWTNTAGSMVETLVGTITAGEGGTGVSNTATLTLGTSNQNWATLGTGIVKNTTTTGALTDAASSDVISLWTGTCSSSTFLNGAGACATPSGSGTVTASAQYDIAYYPTTGTVATVQGAAIAGFVYGSASGAPAAATAAQLGTLVNIAQYDALYSGGTTSAIAGAAINGFQFDSTSGVPAAATATNLGTLANLAANAVVKSGGTTSALAISSMTDNGTTVTSTDTGGYVAPVFVANGTTAGFADFPQGSTSAAVAPCNTATSICEQAPTAVTSYLVVKPPAAGNGVVTNTNTSSVVTQGFSGDAGHSATVTTSSATSVGSTSLCSTTLCPAGTYQVNAYIDVTTACTTTGSYYVSIIYTDDAASKTIVMPLQGTGTTTTYGPSAMTSSLALSATTNFAQGHLMIHSTGAASINYSTTAGACGTGGPAAGKLYLSVLPVQ